jgi:CHASE3 domain sensor protein
MNKNLLIIGGILVVAVGVAYWYIKSTEKDTEPLTQEDKDTLKQIEIV